MIRIATRMARVMVVGAACAACAAPSAKAPQAPQAPGAASDQRYGEAGYVPIAQPSAPAPPKAAPATTPAPAPPAPAAAAPGGGASGTTSRSMAIQSASRDLEASQRELDVAGSDCRNACRALGSMDRAAGRLCELSEGDGEPQRCDDAKRRVYSARDRVKNTCGSCPNGPSVERSAPVPSLR